MKLCYFAAQVRGLFWNYFSVGLDAQAAYGFHSLREKRPWATPTRCASDFVPYSAASCRASLGPDKIGCMPIPR